MKRNQVTNIEAVDNGWKALHVSEERLRKVAELEDWLEENSSGRWAIAGIGGDFSQRTVIIRFELDEDRFHAKMAW